MSFPEPIPAPGILNNSVTSRVTSSVINSVGNVDTETGSTPEVASVDTTANRTSHKNYVVLQNDKKQVIFAHLLRRCDTMAQARVLAGKHGIPQTSQGQRHPFPQLAVLLGQHKECTDFCLTSSEDAATHGIHTAELFTAKELRKDAQDLNPRVSTALNNKKRVRSSLPSTSSKRQKSDCNETLTPSHDWPEILSITEKKELISEMVGRMHHASRSSRTCNYCGSRCEFGEGRDVEASTIDTSILQVAVQHLRDSLHQPHITVDDCNEGPVSICAACCRSISGTKFISVPLFSYANGCWNGAVPDTLKGLSYVEGIAVARARGTRCFIKLEKGPLGQSAALGNVCVLPQQPNSLSTVLPPPLNELSEEIVVVFVSDASDPIKEETLMKSPLLIRRGRILAALLWLKENNPLYSEVIIDEAIVETYPLHAALPAPTQHVLPSAALSSESASYTTYSGQANLAAFEGNDDSVPTLVQGMLDLDNVEDTYHRRKLQAILRLKEGKDPFIKYPSGSTPLSTSYSPQTWTALWPTLFPWGVGAFEDPVRLDTAFGLRKLHFKTHVKRLLSLSDRRFCTHPSFIFTVMNVMQRRASSFSATLATSRSWYAAVQSDLGSVSIPLVKQLQEKLERDPAYCPVASDEQTVFRLISKLRFLSEPVCGSSGEIAGYREEIRAACRVYGLPSFYVTINPADCHHPLAQIFAGRSVDMGPSSTAIDAAERRARAKALAADPVSGARFFHFMMTSFFEVLVGNGESVGIFGRASAHYGIVEAQDRGSLHCHMFIWLKDALGPLDIKTRAEADPSWARRYLTWLEDIVRLDFPVRNEQDAEQDPAMRYTIDPTMIVGPDPSQNDFDHVWPHFLTSVLQRTGQSHQHGATCYKHLPRSLHALRDPDKDCRFRLPRALVPESHFDEDGHVELKCVNGMMNGYNDIIVSTMGCNMDCKAIGSGTAAMAMMHYVTNYISKLGFDSGLVMSALAGSMKAVADRPVTSNDVIPEPLVPEHGPPISVTPQSIATLDSGAALPATPSDQTRLVLLKTVNQMIGKRKLSGQQVAAFLSGFPNRYTLLRFEKVYWGPLLFSVLPNFYKRSASADRSEDTDATLVAVRNDGVTTVDISTFKSAVAENYAWRSEALKDICFWDFLAEYVKKKKSKSHHTQDPPENDVEEREDTVPNVVETTDVFWPFRSGHAAANSHGLGKRKHPVVPVLLGPNIPRRDNGDDDGKYAATMLFLFKPWDMKDTISFKDDDTTWNEAFTTFVSTAEPQILHLMDNMQQLHECRDARDDHSAQRKAREALLRGNGNGCFEELDNGMTDADDEVWQAAMLGATENDSADQDQTSALADSISQRAIDHASAAGFYDVAGPPLRVPMGPETAVSEGGEQDVDRAERSVAALLKEKELVLQQRRAPHTGPSKVLRTRPTVGLSSARTEPILTTWADELELARQKYEGFRFGGIPWRRLKSYQKTCLALIEKFSLNEDQTLAFLLICDAEGRAARGQQVDPLNMIIGGPGGTGKSQIFTAVQEFFDVESKGNRLKLTAPTGVAASNIGGSTIHSEASLRVSRITMRHEKNRTALEDRWRLVSTCVVDEVSFLGATDMSLLNEYLKLAKPDAASSYFGGLNMIFVGDMAQLPPPMSRPLFDLYLTNSSATINAANDGERRALAGITAFRSVTKAVVLSQVMRQSDPTFVALLGRLRYGACTPADKELLDQYVLGTGSKANESNIRVTHWLDAQEAPSPLISYRNGVRDGHNRLMAEAFARASGQEFVFYHSFDKIGKGQNQRVLKHRAAEAAWAVPPKQAGDLYGKLPLVGGTPVFCTENIATELGISNGSEGRVVKIAFLMNDGVRYPISADVDFPAYINSDATAPHPHRVVLKPVKCAFTYRLPDSDKIYSATRWQLPLIPAFAYTCHNSQGRSLVRATVDLASAESAKDKTALAYVMLSRLRSLEGLTILRPFPISVITTHISEQVRKELKRVDQLAAETKGESKKTLSWYYERASTAA